MSCFDKYFYKNKELKLSFLECVTVLNIFFVSKEGVCTYFQLPPVRCLPI